MLRELQTKFNLTYIFISHDLSVIKYISDKVAVMYLGKVVEIASKKTLFANPLHPYTNTLLSAIPVPDPALKKQKIVLKEDVPSPVDTPIGCRFRTRCPNVRDLCAEAEPQLKEIQGGHWAACHLL